VRPAHKAIFWGLVTLIVLAHVALWRSDMPPDLKMTFTILNAIGWSIILLPIVFVSRWMNAIERRNAERAREQIPPNGPTRL